MQAKALLVDRDGVINRMVLYGDQYDSPQSQDDVKLVLGIESVISWANQRRILVIEITNQPGVAKGKMTQKTADQIENRVHKLLLARGAKINKIYICPHHPKGVVMALTKECDCRKPKPGLLRQAARELNIDLTKSVFLGDGAADDQAGKSVGCFTILLDHEENEPKKVEEARIVKPHHRVRSLNKVVPILAKYFK